MRMKILVALFSAAALVGCGGGSDEPTSPTPAPATPSPTPSPGQAPGTPAPPAQPSPAPSVGTFAYEGTWLDTACYPYYDKWRIQTRVISKQSAGIYKMERLTYEFDNAGCPGIGKIPEQGGRFFQELRVIDRVTLADGTVVDRVQTLIQSAYQVFEPEKTIARVEGDRLYMPSGWRGVVDSQGYPAALERDDFMPRMK